MPGSLGVSFPSLTHDVGPPDVETAANTPPPPATTTTSDHQDQEPHLTFGRLAVLPAYRGRGLARLLISAAVQFAQENPTLFNVSQPGQDLTWKGLVCCHAQVGAMNMWARNGFQVDESLGRWWEEGIEHVGMYKRCEIAGQ